MGPGLKYAIRFSEYPYIRRVSPDLRYSTPSGYEVRKSGATCSRTPAFSRMQFSRTVTVDPAFTTTTCSSPYTGRENPGAVNSIEWTATV